MRSNMMNTLRPSHFRSSVLYSWQRGQLCLLCVLWVSGLLAGDAFAQALTPKNATQAEQETQAPSDTTSAPEAETADADAANAPNAALLSTGAGLFKGNCTVCHTINERVIGPALRNVHQRRDVAWIKAFITNSQKVIQSGDEYAVALYNEYNQTQMTAFEFSEEELDAIIAYIIAESAKPIEQATEVASADTQGEAQGGTISQLEMNLLWGGILLVLVLVLTTLLIVASFMRAYFQKRDDLGEEAQAYLNPKKGGLGRALRSTTFLGFVVFFFVAVAIKSTLDGLYSIGIQQGYAPKQPIAFSHKIHAGDYQIDCNYCHTGVYISKSANIPSANICLNCHNEIKKESYEIQKIHRAVEKNRPIEWVRVHNLPDLAYFNHAQHVEVGKVACQTCHGAIESMDVVKQHANLTMGWCINCHKKTEVKTKGNAYYDKLIQVHEKPRPLVVEDIGGLECSKCHY